MFAIWPFERDVLFKKGDKIGQGVIEKYYLTDDDMAEGLRSGGFGSTDAFTTVFNTDSLNDQEFAEFLNGAQD